MRFLFHKKNNGARNIKLSSGLTLLEVLLAASLVSVVGMAIYKSLADGINVWQRMRTLVGEEDVSLFFEELTRDLRNSFLHSKIEYQGKEEQCAFPTIITTAVDPRSNLPAESFIPQIGRVEYFLDLTKRRICRRQANYSQALQFQFGEPVSLVRGVRKLKFTYHYFTEEGETVSEGISGRYPSAVEVEVEFMENDKVRTMKKMILLPKEL